MNQNARYIRTDKNGTQYFGDCTCPRCGGQGGLQNWVYTGFTCYQCGGTGRSKERIYKVYTPEYQAKLDAKRAVRNAKAMQERAVADNQYLMENFFSNGHSLFVVDILDTYPIRDSLKALGARWNANLQSWCFASPIAEYPMVEVEMDTVTYINEYGKICFNEDANRTVEKMLTPAPAKHHIGTVGERMTITAKVKKVYCFDSMYGVARIINMEDSEGNVIVWTTSSTSLGEGRTYTFSAKVKEHSEYKGTPQTVVERATKITEVAPPKVEEVEHEAGTFSLDVLDAIAE